MGRERQSFDLAELATRNGYRGTVYGDLMSEFGRADRHQRLCLPVHASCSARWAATCRLKNAALPTPSGIPFKMC
jgi:hypothetical protein